MSSYAHFLFDPKQILNSLVGMISPRIKCLLNETSAIMQGHLLCASDPFSKENPRGYLNFGIAENHLMEDWTVPFVNQVNKLSAEDLQYFNLSGLEGLKQATVQFLQRHLKTPELNAENVVIMNGLSSVCESLSYALFSAGDYLMIPTPYYSGFEFDFQKRFGVNFLKVHLKESNSFKHTIKDFEEAYERFLHKDKLRALLITHPHNPTGEMIEEDFLKEIVGFAKERNLEIITDEIYALTNFYNKQHKTLLNYAGDYTDHIHFLYGLAKDFTLAGLKVGIFYSENKDVVEAMKLLSYFHCTSSLTQRFAERLLGDEEFVSSFLTENNKRLLSIKSKIKKGLPELKCIDGDSGLFFLIDLRNYMSEPSLAGEKELFDRLLKDYKIFLTPGQRLGMDIPGFFRLCFSKKTEYVEELITRFKKFLSNY